MIGVLGFVCVLLSRFNPMEEEEAVVRVRVRARARAVVGEGDF